MAPSSVDSKLGLETFEDHYCDKVYYCPASNNQLPVASCTRLWHVQPLPTTI